MMNARQYEESLRNLNLKVYMFGERVANVVDNPITRPSMNAVALTYELAHKAGIRGHSDRRIPPVRPEN